MRLATVRRLTMPNPTQATRLHYHKKTDRALFFCVPIGQPINRLTDTEGWCASPRVSGRPLSSPSWRYPSLLWAYWGYFSTHAPLRAKGGGAGQKRFSSPSALVRWYGFFAFFWLAGLVKSCKGREGTDRHD